jgi:hypothetical protein
LTLMLRCEARIERQKQIIAEMERDNHPEGAERARDLMAIFCRTIELMRAHLAELRASNRALRNS